MIYFNEIDPFAVRWLRNLYPDARVDERSIVDVQPRDVHNFERCQFFGGIGGWEYALSLAGWPRGRQVWTGSCPCQPFSNAGNRKGTADARHRWPAFGLLIQQCQPATVFGEQVASKLGRQWLNGVFADLERMGYAVAGADLCAAGAGAPHIRQRLFWVARRSGQRLEGDRHLDARERAAGGRLGPTHGGNPGGLDQSGGERRQWRQGTKEGCVANGKTTEWEEGSHGPVSFHETARFWDRFDIVHCRDNRTRRIEPRSFPLAHGIPARVGRLRGYGNAIVPQVAAEFIKAFLEAEGDITS